MTTAIDPTHDFEQLRERVFIERGASVSQHLLAADTDRPIAVVEVGTGEPLVFLHGGGGNAAEWATLLPLLQDRYRCLAIDRPGHGLSYRVDHGEVPDYRGYAAAFVGRALDLLGLRRAVLVGNSMGGFFALAFALAAPERVERIILVGAPAGVDRWVPLPLRLLGTPGLGRLLWSTVARPSERGMRDLYARLLVADVNKLSASDLACAVAAQSLPGADVALLSMFRRFLNPRGVRDEHFLRDALGALEVPTSFLWGDKDAFAPPASGEALCRAMKDAHLEVIAGAGHLPWVDEPRACADALLAALSATARRRAPSPRAAPHARRRETGTSPPPRTAR